MGKIWGGERGGALMCSLSISYFVYSWYLNSLRDFDTNSVTVDYQLKQWGRQFLETGG